MKNYVVTYNSEDNINDQKPLHIQAKSLVEAQNRFFEYLKTTDLYKHMWQLSVQFEEIGPSI